MIHTGSTERYAGAPDDARTVKDVLEQAAHRAPGVDVISVVARHVGVQRRVERRHVVLDTAVTGRHQVRTARTHSCPPTCTHHDGLEDRNADG